MPIGRHVRLCRNGRNQALRIQREFELDARAAGADRFCGNPPAPRHARAGGKARPSPCCACA